MTGIKAPLLVLTKEPGALGGFLYSAVAMDDLLLDEKAVTFKPLTQITATATPHGFMWLASGSTEAELCM
jgi:hypothetical protein